MQFSGVTYIYFVVIQRYELTVLVINGITDTI